MEQLHNNADYSRSVIGQYCECLYKLIIGSSTSTDDKVADIAHDTLSSSNNCDSQRSRSNSSSNTIEAEEWTEIDLSDNDTNTRNITSLTKKVDSTAQEVLSPLHTMSFEGFKYNISNKQYNCSDISVRIDDGASDDCGSVDNDSNSLPDMDSWGFHVE